MQISLAAVQNAKQPTFKRRLYSQTDLLYFHSFNMEVYAQEEGKIKQVWEMQVWKNKLDVYIFLGVKWLRQGCRNELCRSRQREHLPSPTHAVVSLSKELVNLIFIYEMAS